MILQFILLQAKGGGTGYESFLMLGAIALVFYFFMIRPQQKRQKDAKKFRQALGKGQDIVTIGGIYGRILEVDDDSVLVEVDRSTKLKIQKAAISQEASAKLNAPKKEEKKK